MRYLLQCRDISRGDVGSYEACVGAVAVVLDIRRGDVRLLLHMTITILLVSDQWTSRAATKALTIEMTRVKLSEMRVRSMWVQYE